ncbi:MAG: hypothetical protein NVSMB33_13500 [Ktedonobacteraceae bacterium]
MTSIADSSVKIQTTFGPPPGLAKWCSSSAIFASKGFSARSAKGYTLRDGASGTTR